MAGFQVARQARARACIPIILREAKQVGSARMDRHGAGGGWPLLSLLAIRPQRQAAAPCNSGQMSLCHHITL